MDPNNGTLHALDANNVANSLYTSGSLGSCSKWTTLNRSQLARLCRPTTRWSALLSRSKTARLSRQASLLESGGGSLPAFCCSDPFRPERFHLPRPPLSPAQTPPCPPAPFRNPHSPSFKIRDAAGPTPAPLRPESALQYEETRTNPHASLVQALHPHAARSAGRCRSRQPHLSIARRLYPPARRGYLLLSLSRAALDEQNHRHRARGDGPHRAGVLSSLRSTRAKSGRPPAAGPPWATICSASRTARAPTSRWA